MRREIQISTEVSLVSTMVRSRAREFPPLLELLDVNNDVNRLPKSRIYCASGYHSMQPPRPTTSRKTITITKAMVLLTRCSGRSTPAEHQ
jgi:hypothetical protein